MPVSPVELTAEFTVETSPEGERSPKEQIEAGREAAGASGLAQETGPESMALSGSREEVLEALLKVIGAALDAGARGVSIKVEVVTEVRRKA